MAEVRAVKVESSREHTPAFGRYLQTALVAATILYAFLAGLRTVADFDLGWQLASGRYIVQHHSIPSTDVLSYTAHGAPWIYPVLSQIIFYLLFLIGGYAALSWLGAVACAGTVALCLRRGMTATAVLAIVAVPAIAFRTLPRAELFSTVLFAATLTVLWKYHRTGSGRLWLLPILFALWANLHLGFISGLALLAAYVAWEVLEMPFADRRALATKRLGRAWLWLLASAGATLLNPWGWGIYRAVWRQQEAMSAHNRMITEWSGVRLNLGTMAEGLQWRNPNSGFWWLLLVAFVVVAIALWKKQLGIALLVGGAAVESVAHIRFQGLFAVVVVVLGGSIIGESIAEKKFRVRSAFAYALAAVLLVFVSVRMIDLVTSRAYLANGEISTFGSGASWWLPERAAQFVRESRAPANVFHDYDLGGFVAWRLGPEYPDFVDGRAIPFGSELLEQQATLMQTPPDAPEWQAEADQRGIQTLFYSTARYAGLSFPLAQLCQSTQWKTVYLDDVAVVAVRNSAANQAFIQAHAVDCSKIKFFAPPEAASSQVRLYNFYANTGAILYLLNRDAEAWEAYRSALAIFNGDANLHLSIAQLLEAEGKGAEAEKEYRESLRLRPTEVAWYGLARLLSREHRYHEAIAAVERSADLAVYPAGRYQSLGQLFLFLKRQNDALQAFDRAEKAAAKGPENRELMAKIYEGQAQAYKANGDLSRAIERQRKAVDSSPADLRRRQALDELLKAQPGGGAEQR